MSGQFKGSAAPMGGYLYQNLVGLELLCNWLDNPTLYDWVRFEADQDAVPKGLDDIQAMRPDGRMVLFQVKFTVDPFDPENPLSWDWLLKHRPRGRSLLQKWADAATSVGLPNVYDASLVERV